MHRTTHQRVLRFQRRNRWLLYAAAALLVFAVNRCAVCCRKPTIRFSAPGRVARILPPKSSYPRARVRICG